MGGGRNYFTMKRTNSTGKRLDEDLVKNWMNDKQTRFNDKTAKYVTNKKELMSTDMSNVDFVLGNGYFIIIKYYQLHLYIFSKSYLNGN